jgi:hypothetical protein
MQKLTLSVDRRVVDDAKRYAQARGTSVSRLVETMLRLVSTSASPAGRLATPPVLARLRGSLATGDRRAHRQYLERKHR